MKENKIVPEKQLRGLPKQQRERILEENHRVRISRKFGNRRSKFAQIKIEMKESGYWDSFIKPPKRMTLAEAEALDKKRKEEREIVEREKQDANRKE